MRSQNADSNEKCCRFQKKNLIVSFFFVPFRSNFYSHSLWLLLYRRVAAWLFFICCSSQLVEVLPVCIINNRCLCRIFVFRFILFCFSFIFPIRSFVCFYFVSLFLCQSFYPLCMKSQTKIEIRNNPKYQIMWSCTEMFSTKHTRYQSLEGWFKRNKHKTEQS